MSEADGPNRMGSVSLGVTVIALYVLFVSLVAFGFGSYIYRTTWQVDAVTQANGDQLQAQSNDIDNTLFIIGREKSLEEAIVLIRSDIAVAQVELSKFDGQISQSFGPIRLAKNALRYELSLTLDAMEDYRYDLPGDARSQYELIMNDPEIEPDPKVRNLIRIVQNALFPTNADVDQDARDAFDDLVTRTETAFIALNAAYTEANNASLALQAEKLGKVSRIKALNDRLANHDAVIAELQETLPLASAARARLAALSFESEVFPNVLMRLVSFPTIFLTMIVTIAAGGLGTVVAFSRRYYSANNSDALTLSRLFVNVGEGIAAAIAIFLFSGAGMLALTQGGGTSNDVELSPYTVAFIAFLSGFMAEDAFASIQSAGKRIFKTETADNTPDTPVQGPQNTA